MALMLIACCIKGNNYPTFFLLAFSSLIIIGDLFKKEDKIERYSYPFFLNLALYINLPVLFILAFFIVSIFSNSLPGWYLNGFINILNIDLNVLNQSFSLIDKFSIIFSTSLFIGSLGIVTAHELTHRKK